MHLLSQSLVSLILTNKHLEVELKKDRERSLMLTHDISQKHSTCMTCSNVIGARQLVQQTVHIRHFAGVICYSKIQVFFL